jgi:hypothetical protein
MAGEELGTRNALGAVLFMTASMNTLDAYSTLNSSPWTAESFGADPRRSKALKEYVTHAVFYSLGYAAASAWIVQGSIGWWIILGALITNVYLVWLYMRASRRGREAGDTDWMNS